MQETITAIKSKLKVIENTYNSLQEGQRANIKIGLDRIDKDLRSLILLGLAISKR